MEPRFEAARVRIRQLLCDGNAAGRPDIAVTMAMAVMQDEVASGRMTENWTAAVVGDELTVTITGTGFNVKLRFFLPDLTPEWGVVHAVHVL